MFFFGYIGCISLSAPNSRSEVAARIFRILKHMLLLQSTDTDMGTQDTANSKNSNMTSIYK